MRLWQEKQPGMGDKVFLFPTTPWVLSSVLQIKSRQPARLIPTMQRGLISICFPSGSRLCRRMPGSQDGLPRDTSARWSSALPAWQAGLRVSPPCPTGRLLSALTVPSSAGTGMLQSPTFRQATPAVFQSKCWKFAASAHHFMEFNEVLECGIYNLSFALK